MGAMGAAGFANACARLSGERPPTVANRRALEQLDIAQHTSAYLGEEGREGLFRWRDGDLSSQIAGDPLQGIYVASARAPSSTGAWVRDFDKLRPQMFGATARADDTASLQAFLSHLGDGVDGEISELHTVRSELYLDRKRGFRLGGGGTIRAGDDVPVTYGFGLLRLIECHDFVLSDLTFDGNRAGRDAVEAPAHSVIFQSCSRFQCNRVRSDNAVTDGFILLSITPDIETSHCRDFSFIDCHADNCFRQGCSVIQGHSGSFLGGSYTRTSGTIPAAGIDLESDPGAPEHSIENIRFERVTFEGNDGYGLLVAAVSSPRNIQAIDCNFINNHRGAISWGARTGLISRPMVKGFGDRGQRGAIDIPFGTHCEHLLIEDPVFRDITATSEERPLIYVHGESGGNVVTSGLDADKCAAVAALWGDNCKLINSRRIVPDRARFHGAIIVFGANCEVRGNFITKFYGTAIYADGQAVKIIENTLMNPIFNDKNGCIRVVSPGSELLDNSIHRPDMEDGYGIIVKSPARIEGNVIEGFDTYPYVIL